MRSTTYITAALLAATTVFAQTPTQTSKGVQEPSSAPRLRVITVQGCFESEGELVFNSTLEFNSKSSCVQDTCNAGGYEVAGTRGGNECWCGHRYPPKSTKVDDKRCNQGCSGYDIQACGGEQEFTIYNTGLTVVVDTTGDDPLRKGSGTGGSTTPVTTKTESTVVVTQTNAAVESKGPNVGAIAGGVVVGVVVVTAIVAGMFFYLRRKRNKEIEEEHRRNAAVNSFMSGKPTSSAGSITDARLDPVMAQRRMSDGSIADNQDYSRKILRVTNA